MKISAVSTRIQQPLKANLNNQSQVAFGFGEDYVNDDFTAINDYQRKESSESVFNYLKLIGEFFVALIQEKCCEPDYSNIISSNKNDSKGLCDEDFWNEADEEISEPDIESDVEEKSSVNLLEDSDFDLDDGFC